MHLWWIKRFIHYRSKIGKECYIGAHSCIIGKSPYQEVPIIGDHVFIGHNTIICGPIKVGNNAIIANGAVVLKSVPENVIVAGVPATIIGYRTNLKYDLLKPEELINGFMPYYEYSQPSK